MCVKCGRHPVEYDAPDRYCFNCWTEWWVDGLEIESHKERQIELKRLRKELKKKDKRA